jgi:hypothetical protein
MSYGLGKVTSPEASLSAGPNKGAMELADDKESPELRSIRTSRKRQVEKI